jgi:hypothetical protein
MARQRPVLFESLQLHRPSGLRPLGLELHQLLHYRVVNQPRPGQIDGQLASRIGRHQPLPQRQPIGENGRAEHPHRGYGRIVVIDFDVGFNQRPRHDAVKEVQHDLQGHADCHADQQVGRKDADDRRHEDCQLPRADMVHVGEFLGMREPAARVDQHRRKRSQRNPVDQPWQERHEQ